MGIMNSPKNIQHRLDTFENDMQKTINNTFSDIIGKVNAGLDGILQTIMSSAEELENGMKRNVSEVKTLFNKSTVNRLNAENEENFELNTDCNESTNGDSVDNIEMDEKENELLNDPAEDKYDIDTNSIFCNEITSSQLYGENNTLEDQSILTPDGLDDELGEDYSELENYDRSSSLKQGESIKEDLQCGNCNYTALGENSLKMHIKQVHEKNLHCGYCTYNTGNQGNLKNHINAVHEKKKNIKCGQCSYAGGFKSALNSHTKRFHPT